jgi:hypothetical protein
VIGSSSVVFSEDLDPLLMQLREAGDFIAEYIQARAADAVIIIPESPGALVETASYAEELRGKTIVFATRRGEEGFARHAYATLKVEDVEREEWEQCDRVRRKAREFVETMRLNKFRRIRKVFDWEIA